MAVVASEVVSVGLTLHLFISCSGRPCHNWCALGSCLLAGHIPQWQESRSYGGCHIFATGWLAYMGARDLHCLSACDLEASEWASICS